MTSFGAAERARNAPSIVSGVQLTTMHRLSSNSRMVCTCGRIRRPLGACASCGMISITTSPSVTRSPVMVASSAAPRPSSPRRRMSLSMPSPVRALTATGSMPVRRRIRSMNSSRFSMVSILLSTATTGTLRCPNMRTQASSVSLSPVPYTTRAMSVRSAALRVCSRRRSPSSLSSSKPAVSMNVTAPRPGTSILLFTGSVVVPGSSETTAVCWPVMALMSDDLPLLHLP